MSWQGYIDNLIGSGRIDKAALYSKDGTGEWAKSPGFDPTAEEVQKLAKGFDDASPLQEQGLHLQGSKYFVIRADDRSIYGKLEQTGIIAVRTAQTILIAHYPEGVQPGEATKVTEQLADYLISVNF